MANKITITVEALLEDITPEQEARSIGNRDFLTAVKEVKRKAKQNGTPLWGWCTVKVTVKNGVKTGEAYLGCCSYVSPIDFLVEGGYFESLVMDACSNMRANHMAS